MSRVASRRDAPFREAFRGRTVLVTGDTGFKGSWLTLWLTHLGARVVGFAHPPRTTQDNYVVCGLHDAASHVDGDVRDAAALRRTFHDARPDFAFHLAAQALVLDSYDDPHGTFETNIMGTVNFLDAVRATPSVRVAVVITSDKCYDNHEWVYGYRETDPLGGLDPYSASKAAAELVTASLRHSFFQADDTAHVATARAGNVIGGGDWASNRIVPDCIRALREGHPITIRNPYAVRPWQHVLDPLSGYLTLATRLWTDGTRYAGPWNFGPAPGAMVSVSRLVDEVIAQWGQGVVSFTDPDAPRPAEAGLLHLDISKAVNHLGWSPRLSFAKAVQFTIDGYRIEGEVPAAVRQHRLAQIDAFQELPGERL